MVYCIVGLVLLIVILFVCAVIGLRNLSQAGENFNRSLEIMEQMKREKREVSK